LSDRPTLTSPKIATISTSADRSEALAPRAAGFRTALPGDRSGHTGRSLQEVGALPAERCGKQHDHAEEDDSAPTPTTRKVESVVGNLRLMPTRNRHADRNQHPAEQRRARRNRHRGVPASR
jgi:hypothetical protein